METELQLSAMAARASHCDSDFMFDSGCFPVESESGIRPGRQPRGDSEASRQGRGGRGLSRRMHGPRDGTVSEAQALRGPGHWPGGTVAPGHGIDVTLSVPRCGSESESLSEGFESRY